MSTTRILGDEIYEYPDTGDINYGEEASGWVGSATGILGQVSGPGDIQTTTDPLTGSDDGTYISGGIPNMLFNTAFVQSINITGFIKRTYTDSTPTKVEEFNIRGAYNGSIINFTVEYAGDDTDLEFSVVGGQFNFKYLKNGAVDNVVTVKYSAKAQVDEAFFA